MSDRLFENEEIYAVVEVMGHNTFAGKVSEHVVGGTAFIRVDVPALEAEEQHTYVYPSVPAFTKLIGAGSIYAITPCSKEVALQVAKRGRVSPVSVLDLSPTVKRIAAAANEARFGFEDDGNV